MKKRFMMIAFAIYYVLNIVNTYVLTTQTWNKYFSSFQRTFLSEFTSILGNFAVLTIILIILFALVKKADKRVLGMGIISIVLGILVFALKIYTKYYETVFSFQTLTVFKNPAANLGLSIIFEAVKEFFIGFGFVVLIPGVLLIGYSVYLHKTGYQYNFLSGRLSVMFKTTLALAMLLISFTTFYIFGRVAAMKWPYENDITSFGVQYAGVYNFYLYDILGLTFKNETENVTIEEINNEIEQFNHNGIHVNFIDGKTYSSPFLEEYAIFKDKNLYVLHLESVNSFLIDLKVNGIEVMPNLNKIMRNPNVYSFDNYYTNSGQGVSADAEMAIMTGITNNGSSTFHWDYEDIDYVMEGLPKLFKEANSEAVVESYHGDIRAFYNREAVHERLFGFDKYFSVENYNETHPDAKEDKYISGWVSDKEMINWVDERINEIDSQYFLYNILTVSHTPFLHNPIEGTLDFNLESEILSRYLTFMRYVDELLGDFIEEKSKDTNTVFYVYGDHGCGLNDGSLKELFPDKSNLEIKQILRKVVGFFYDPSGELNTFMGGNMHQSLLRSHLDIYTTICALWGLKPVGYTFGVNALSSEPTFVYNPVTFTIYTDNYLYSVKRPSDAIIYNDYDKMRLYAEVSKIELYKKCIDGCLKYNLFQNYHA